MSCDYRRIDPMAFDFLSLEARLLAMGHSQDYSQKFTQKRRDRNKPCPCGSLRKFKRCCWRGL